MCVSHSLGSVGVDDPDKITLGNYREMILGDVHEMLRLGQNAITQWSTFMERGRCLRDVCEGEREGGKRWVEERETVTEKGRKRNRGRWEKERDGWRGRERN